MRQSPLRNESIKDMLISAGYNMDDFNINDEKWFVPADILKEVTGKRFTSQMKKGWNVTLRSRSTRRYRRRWTSTADNQDFLHYGLGSGKTYGDILPNEIRVNTQYVYNRISSTRKVQFLRSRGCYISYNESWNRSKYEIKDNHFVDSILLKADGIFGPKQIINGTIVELYVYFNNMFGSRREARYKVQWECGSEGIFTADYLNRSFCTDYDLDEKLVVCNQSDMCKNLTCKEHGPHIPDGECAGGSCFIVDKLVHCVVCHDYTKFMDTVVGTGIVPNE